MFPVPSLRYEYMVYQAVKAGMGSRYEVGSKYSYERIYEWVLFEVYYQRPTKKEE